jgi:hypothetical protein
MPIMVVTLHPGKSSCPRKHEIHEQNQEIEQQQGEADFTLRAAVMNIGAD